MFKKILFSFCILLSVIGFTSINVLAKESRAYTAPDGKIYANYFRGIHSTEKVPYEAYSNGRMYIDSRGQVLSNAEAHVYINGKYFRTAPAGGQILHTTYFGSNIQLNGRPVNPDGTYPDGGGSETVPPIIPPTAMEGVTEIPRALSEQLSVLLPIGVLILSTLLLVPLIKRLKVFLR